MVGEWVGALAARWDDSRGMMDERWVDQMEWSGWTSAVCSVENLAGRSVDVSVGNSVDSRVFLKAGKWADTTEYGKVATLVDLLVDETVVP